MLILIFTFDLVSVCLFIFKCAEIETLKVKCVVQPEQGYFVKTVCVCRILSCLMEHLYTDKMVEDCEHRLLELQYFISRDWK